MLCVRGYFAEVLLLILLAPLCAHAQEKNHVAPEQMDKAIREIEKLAQKQIQENALPGLAIAVVFQDKTAYAKGFGVRDVNTNAPIDADSVFQLASVLARPWLPGWSAKEKSPGTRNSASSIPHLQCSIRG
jgi:Beta-lactamase